MDYLKYNREAWNEQTRCGCEWTVPVDQPTIAKARQGEWSIVLTPQQAVPADWMEPVKGKDILCLAGGGGQQAPILAAAGANVTTFDNSDQQLEQDQIVARREGLTIGAIQGDMADLSAIDDASFDLIVNPCSNCFVPDLQPVWNECFRVLRPSGHLISGWTNPILYVFDYEESQQGNLVVRHKIPYSDQEALTETELQKLIDENEPLCYGHTLEDQIGGQLRAGFQMVDFYEDDWGESGETLSKFIQSFCATRSQKP